MPPNLPPRRVSGARVSCRAGGRVPPLQILLQMAFPKHRALKALAATGNRSVQLASDWLLTHVNDTSLDLETPREYILYACPSGELMAQLQDFWEKSKVIGGWNRAHNYPPHVTLVSFFKAPDDCSLQLAKLLKSAVESVGCPPDTPLKLDPYMSHNFMGLFVGEEHADYFKKIAVEYVKQVSSATICLEPHVKSLHITLAYQFRIGFYNSLKMAAEQMQLASSDWELKLYSRDSRFTNHLVHKVRHVYEPEESDELELVLGDYIYIDETELNNSTDGWVQGTSWLTGVTGYLPAVYTVRTGESDAWTLHRVISLSNSSSSDSKSESDSATEGENGAATQPNSEAASEMGLEKSEESFQEWLRRYDLLFKNKLQDVLNSKSADVTNGIKDTTNGDHSTNGNNAVTEADQAKQEETASSEQDRRWILSLRHGERIDMTYGSWIPFCYDDDGNYVRKDLNMPLEMPERTGGKWSFMKDCPLTRVGQLQGMLVGEGLREAGVVLSHVYSSPAMRCVETAQALLKGLNADPSLKIKIEPGLFEYKVWHAKGIGLLMTPLEFHKAGYSVDLSYKPYVEMSMDPNETVEEYYQRGAAVTHGAYKDTQVEGGNIMFVGHACTLDTMWQTLRRYGNDDEHPPYALSRQLGRVPYCALAAMKEKPFQLVAPPCPPSMNTSSGRFDWKLLFEMHNT